MLKEIIENPFMYDTHVTVTKEGRALFTLDDMCEISSDVFGLSKTGDVPLHFVFYDNMIYVAAVELAAATGRTTTAACNCAISYNTEHTRKFAVSATYDTHGVWLRATGKGKYRSYVARTVAFLDLPTAFKFVERQQHRFFSIADPAKDAAPKIVHALVEHNKKQPNPDKPIWRTLAYVSPDGMFLGLNPGNKPCPTEKQAIHRILESGWTPNDGPIHLYQNDVVPRREKHGKKKRQMQLEQQPKQVVEKHVPQVINKPDPRPEVTIIVPRGIIVRVQYES